MISDAELETRLRRVLVADAALADVTAEAWGAGRPLRRINQPLRLAAAAALVVGVGAVTFVVVNSSHSTAYASWRSVPTIPTAAQAAALEKACGVTSALAVDLRGTGGYVVSRTGSAVTDCLTAVPGEAADRGLRSDWTTLTTNITTKTPTPRDPLLVLTAKAPEGNSVHRAPVTWVSGRIDASVTKVIIETSAGQVVATVNDGSFAAWWPGNDGDTAVVQALGSNGELLARADQLSCTDSVGVLSPRLQVAGSPPSGGCPAPASRQPPRPSTTPTLTIPPDASR